MSLFLKRTKCPVCESNKVFSGKVVDSEGGNYSFNPQGLKWWASFIAEVKVDSDFRACKTCGHVWSQLDPSELTKLLERKGTAETKAKLAASDR
jgi:hypothetical protein